jgi:hypothetical protein
MPCTSHHTKWLVDTGERLKTADGKEVEVWEFRHEKDETVLSAWAKHFRNHYCLDAEIDFLRGSKLVKTISIHLKSLAALRSLAREYELVILVKSSLLITSSGSSASGFPEYVWAPK